MEKIKIDLACGNAKREGFTGVDYVKTDSTDIVHDLTQYPWPFEDNSVDEINCSHYIEHIPHDIKNGDDRDGLIQFMDEVYRILKPDAKAHITAPYYKSERAFGDPTHKRYIGDLSFPYYNKQWRDVNGLSHYGINCNFDIRLSYHIDNELTLKSEVIRNECFKKDWNDINDIIVEMTKKVLDDKID